MEGGIVIPLTPDDDGQPEGFDVEQLISRVCNGMSARNRERTPRELVAEVVRSLDLQEKSAQRTAVRLKIHRLKFSGEKHLVPDGPPEPFVYDQAFSEGVNVLLIRDNSVGKSSVMKTIKYALTGDDSDYDANVRSWIQRVWLHFSLDAAYFTIHITRRHGADQGYVAFGSEERNAEDAELLPNAVYRMSGSQDISDKLQKFFMERLGIAPLYWTQATAAGAEARGTTWRTYFQALVVPDSSDRYLLIEPEHAIGNQEGLILQTFLGLRLIGQINQLLVDKGKIRKENTVTDAERAKAHAEAEELRREVAAVELRVAQLDAVLQGRAIAFQAAEPTVRLSQIRFLGAEKDEAHKYLLAERDALTEKIYRARASARHISEYIALHLHFTGLDVALCPNCDAHVDAEAVERERAEHHCRLCGKAAHAASPEEVEALEAQATALVEQAEADRRLRDKLSYDIGRLQRETEELEREAAALRDVAIQGASVLLPTEHEKEERSRSERRAGELIGRIAILEQKASEFQAAGDEAALRADIQDRIRKILVEDAEFLNESTLSRLGALTAETVHLIGADNISQVTCSALGRLTLWKNDTKVAFGGIRNPGERLRVKLAFFIALMRLGGENAGSRHPGFLLIDQPGSAEMVDDDFAALAAVLREVETHYANKLQIICFTARSQFEGATSGSKVYGAQGGRFAF